MRWLTLLGVLYPVVAYIGIHLSSPNLPILYLSFLVAVFLFCSTTQSWLNKLILFSVIILIDFVVFAFNLAYVFMQLLPIGILLMLVYVFSQSLRPNKVPIITRFAQCVEGGDLNTEKRRYTKTITKLWLSVFVYMILQNTITSIWLPVELWSWFANIGNYLIIATLMLLEFTYRQKRFRHETHGLKDFLIKLLRCKNMGSSI